MQNMGERGGIILWALHTVFLVCYWLFYFFSWLLPTITWQTYCRYAAYKHPTINRSNYYQNFEKPSNRCTWATYATTKKQWVNYFKNIYFNVSYYMKYVWDNVQFTYIHQLTFKERKNGHLPDMISHTVPLASMPLVPTTKMLFLSAIQLTGLRVCLNLYLTLSTILWQTTFEFLIAFSAMC